MFCREGRADPEMRSAKRISYIEPSSFHVLFYDIKHTSYTTLGMFKLLLKKDVCYQVAAYIIMY